MIAVPKAATFAFTKLVVHDLAKEAAFYQAVCGYREPELLKAEMGGRPIEEIILRNPEGELDLVLLTYVGEGPPIPGGEITAFDTDDLDACQARVLDAGGSIVHAIVSVEVGTSRMRIAFFADPEGHLLEVMER
jgi:predicted enzyme related to lactoylglutathione lyase